MMLIGSASLVCCDYDADWLMVKTNSIRKRDNLTLMKQVGLLRCDEVAAVETVGKTVIGKRR